MSDRGRITAWRHEERNATSPGAMTSAVSGERLQVVRAELAAGTHFETHTHPHEQITVVLFGCGVASVGDLAEEVGPGSVVQIPAGVEHGLTVSEDGPMTTLETFSPPRASLSHAAPE